MNGLNLPGCPKLLDQPSHAALFPYPGRRPASCFACSAHQLSRRARMGIERDDGFSRSSHNTNSLGADNALRQELRGAIFAPHARPSPFRTAATLAFGIGWALRITRGALGAGNYCLEDSGVFLSRRHAKEGLALFNLPYPRRSRGPSVTICVCDRPTLPCPKFPALARTCMRGWSPAAPLASENHPSRAGSSERENSAASPKDSAPRLDGVPLSVRHLSSELSGVDRETTELQDLFLHQAPTIA